LLSLGFSWVSVRFKVLIRKICVSIARIKVISFIAVF
jgi:hypothetical protein